MYTIWRYLFRDKWTNEVFPVDSSFAIPQQAIERHPKYIVSRLEHALGYGDPPHKRFEQIGEGRELK